MTDDTKPRLRGFAALSPERRSEIGKKGGASVKAENRAYARDPELAKRAARKGGLARSKKETADG